MPRSIVLGNDRMHVGFDLNYVLRDLMFPTVGQENHLAGEPARTGVWMNGRFAWLEAPEWSRAISYLEDTLVSDVRLSHDEWGLELQFNDAVDLDRNVLLRRVTAVNHSGDEADIRLFFHYDFHIYGVAIGDTVMFDPGVRGLMAYKGRRYFLANVQIWGRSGVACWATGVTEHRGHEGTWRDAEDGRLEGNPVAQGSVDATVALPMGVLPPGASVTGYHWLAAGRSRSEVHEIDRVLRDRGPGTFIDRTRDWWRAWRGKEAQRTRELPEPTRRLYARSLLTIRTHLDSNGAILAATDSDILSFSRDTYAYCWPRDGALVAIALARAGYGELARSFFSFMRSVFRPEDGYFLHKFNPLGDVASTWHPWIGSSGDRQLAIQEDETGLVLHALRVYYESTRSIEFIKPLYRPVIRAAADFMTEFRDPISGLVLPSYDLWEERRGIHAFTIASVWAGLEAAAFFADTFNQAEVARQYHRVADELRIDAREKLWSGDRGHYLRRLCPGADGSLAEDPVVDSSVLSLALLGMVHPAEPEMKRTAAVVRERLWCQAEAGGLARYEGDPYQYAADGTGDLPGNPWLITTMWLAQYDAMAAEKPEDLQRPLELLQWAEDRAQPGGLLPEQLHPSHGGPISVSPLTWSHAEYLSAVHAYQDALLRLGTSS